MSGPALIVMAKEPVAGRAKTRLCPPLAPPEAAQLAAAALHDTLEAARRVAGARVLLALSGSPGPWLPPEFEGEIVRQRRGALGDRLAGAFVAAGGPALAIGMDTPQLTAPLLERALGTLLGPSVNAVLGPSLDGGYWGIGLRRADARVFAGVPMSTPDTGAVQRTRIRDLGLRVAALEPLRDVDTIEDARAVADASPGTRFAAMLRSLTPILPAGAEA